MKDKVLLGLLLSGSLLLGACSGGAPKPPETDGVSVDAIVEGRGESPTEGDVVLINYKGFLPDGSVFDEAEGAVLPLEGIIPGFSQALLKMRRGGKYIVKIPSKLGYGADTAGPVPPNTDLKFEITLLDFGSRNEANRLMARASNTTPGVNLPRLALRLVTAEIDDADSLAIKTSDIGNRKCGNFSDPHPSHER